ncbi:hypothetical protein F8M41_018544 [Gigaspora margarita]|uniref:Uncharacterized protein n=1 Tax=Gigaspora margarita TaxID=4874 RepID=A0A8H4ALE3_GIGMA|nr:hypothetical protein F8M41_018544 [Gigaspora margarita]
MHNEGQSFFCTREEKYGTMAYWEVSDPTRNYDLATRINHHCYLSRSAGSAYDMNIDKIFRIAKVLLRQTELTMDQALKERQEDKYSLEHENDDYPEKGSEFENYYHSEYAEETDLQEALERSLQTFTEWTREMSISKTDKTFPNGYNQCQACYMCFDKENTDDLEKIYSIDEEKEIYYCKGYCYNVEICDECTKSTQEKEKEKPLTIKEPKGKQKEISYQDEINFLYQRINWFETTVRKQQEYIDLLKYKLDLMNSQKRHYKDKLRFLMDEVANLMEKSLQQDTYIPFDPMTQSQQIIDGSLVANAEFQERILNDDEDIFMEDADAFREAMVQKAHEQNQNLIDLMENETIRLYHSHLLEPEKREPPRKRARSADSWLEKNYAPIINISINKEGNDYGVRGGAPIHVIENIYPISLSLATQKLSKYRNNNSYLQNIIFKDFLEEQKDYMFQQTLINDSLQQPLKNNSKTLTFEEAKELVKRNKIIIDNHILPRFTSYLNLLYSDIYLNITNNATFKERYKIELLEIQIRDHFSTTELSERIQKILNLTTTEDTIQKNKEEILLLINQAIYYKDNREN